MGSQHPDSAIHPVATGKAAETVRMHAKTGVDADITLYSGWFCPFVQRAWITILEKGINIRYVEINPYLKEPEFLKLNPRGLVPTLGCPRPDGSTKPLIESSIICEYLDDSFPNSKPLFPVDLFERARLKISIDFVTSRVVPAFHRFLQVQRTQKNPYTLEDAREEFLESLLTFIKDADPEGPYFDGPDIQMPDIILAPWAVRLWVFDHFKGGLGIPEEGKGGEYERLWTRWRKWVKAIETRDSVINTLSDQEHYLPIYQRYAEDRAQSELAKATRAGRSVP